MNTGALRTGSSRKIRELKIASKSEASGGSLEGGFSTTVSYTADGMERADKNNAGRETWTTVNWQGASLVVLRVMKDGYRVTVIRSAWTLSADGRTLITQQRVISMDGVTESKSELLKQ